MHILVKKMKRPNAIIVDDHLMVAESFNVILKSTGDFDLITICNSIARAREDLLSRPYDCLFTDLLMPESDVKEFIRFARRSWPKLIITVISSETDVSEVRSLFSTGVNAYLSKSVGVSELKTAIKKIIAGERYLSSDLAADLVMAVIDGEKPKLSKREIEILRYVASGKSILDTASALNLSHHTVIAHRRNIMEKLGIHSAAEMVKYAYEHKLY
jgi:DNA-binding NarL/FixJ family response regulator